MTGVVVGYGRGPMLIRVAVDGRKQRGTWHVDFWRREHGEAA
jgi:hypothetical protein